MSRLLKIALNGSFALSLIGVIGIPSVLFLSGISTKHFSQCIAWYAGFRDSAPRWPFLIYKTDIVGSRRVTECETSRCPDEKLTEIFKKFLGHIQTITGQPEESRTFDPAGFVRSDFAAERKKAKAEMCAALYPNDDAGAGISCLLLDGEGPYVDDRATTVLFFLIWFAVIGAPGSVARIVLWMRVKTDDEVQLRLG